LVEGGDKAGLTRYGYAYVPLDEALSRVVLDLSGRPGLELNVNFTRAMRSSFVIAIRNALPNALKIVSA
jgi:imidazoleglycerol phosphate dehydratase HisB